MNPLEYAAALTRLFDRETINSLVGLGMMHKNGGDVEVTVRSSLIVALVEALVRETNAP